MTVPNVAIDHLTVTAPTLESGAAYVREALGVEMGPGGEHPRMGTHNLLLRLGESSFLEVIAPNPAAPRPGRPRWFGLDDPAILRVPRLSTWVLRVDDLRAWPHARVAPLGAIETMTRGAREWFITIPADGTLPLDGVAPALIEWRTPREPAARSLPEAGCALVSLALRHPRAASLAWLAPLAAREPPVTVNDGTSAGLVAAIATPVGVRTLGQAD